ncbi:MAG: glycosyltransferase family 39 protein [Solirubrobacterales bacterium]|nr:glycosyltransferase family 39 protein [Solirubrobacterales bacterium]
MRSLVTGRPEDPWWSRPGLIAVGALAGGLVFWALTVSGYANSWYADAALAASRSWKAFFDNAADLSGVVTLDKGPLSDWMMGLSGRILGFSSFSMLLPDALCGVASVVLLHNVVRRTLGHRAALLAALTLALSPVSVVMARYNNPDALLALLLVAAAWALVRAIESGRLRHILLCGAFVGLAFNTKMLEAYIIVPGLAVAFLIASRGGLRRRIGHLLAGGVVMIVVSFAWFGTMMLIPAASRPFVDSTTNDSWFSLIFGYNGLSRLTGGGRGGFGGAGAGRRLSGGAQELFGGRHFGAGGFGGLRSSTGLTRLFTGADVGGQIGWLLLFALAGLIAGLWATRRAAREDRARAAYVMSGLWALAGFVVFSFAQGTFHPYYTSAMAPAVAVLAGGGAVLLFDRARTGWGWAAALAAAVAATAVVSFLLLGDTPSFIPWLRWAVLAAGALSVLAVLLLGAGLHRSSSSGGRRSRRAVFALALGGSLVALLAGPTAYSIATLGHGQTGSNPAAGPASAVAAGGFGRASQTAGDLAPSSAAARGGAAGDVTSRALVDYLVAHRDGARYLVAATGSQTAAPIALATGDPVITMGGFMGSTPAPTVPQLRAFIAKGELRYVIVGGGFGGFGGFGQGSAGPGGSGGDVGGRPSGGSSGASLGLSELFGSPDHDGGGFAGGARSSATTALTAWVRSSCQAVTVPGYSTSPSASAGAGSTGGGGASTTRGRAGGSLYLCTRADATGAP